MIEEIFTGILTSFGTGLSERLINRRGEPVDVQPIADDVKGLIEQQKQTEVAVKELTSLFREVVEHTDGLVWSQGRIRARAVVRFEPTDETVTLADALRNLDAYIREARAHPAPPPPTSLPAPAAPPVPAVPPAAAGGTAPVPGGTAARASETARFFTEIDHDIQRRRTGGEAGEPS
ncbi:hypothetical protein ACWD4X_21735 [Streptomyces termitum]